MSFGTASDSVLQGLHDVLNDLEGLYKDIHSHPELSMQEQRTGGLAAERLKAAGFEVTEVNHVFLDVVKTIKARKPA